jgi:hypothetical protein
MDQRFELQTKFNPFSYRPTFHPVCDWSADVTKTNEFARAYGSISNAGSLTWSYNSTPKRAGWRVHQAPVSQYHGAEPADVKEDNGWSCSGRRWLATAGTLKNPPRSVRHRHLAGDLRTRAGLLTAVGNVRAMPSSAPTSRGLRPHNEYR